MSASLYKVLHLFGVLLTFMGLAALCVHAMLRRPGSEVDELAGDAQRAVRRLAGLMHGLGLTLVLVAGFGMLARLGYDGFPPWLWGKLVIWLALGAAVVVPRRAPGRAALLLLVLPLVGALAAALAIYQPG
ncbi:MAG: hypothetical protein PVF43_06265 [Candidatus Eiseniibacteriota bacterium]|jgi:hypothetical protein